MNKHGLSRTIPSDVKLEIRKNAGFGCVICGVGIIEYEHVDPEYKDAETHDPKCMTILCPTCHSKKTRGFLFTDQIKEAMLSPKALQVGFSKEFLSIGKKPPTIILGGITFSKCLIPIKIAEQPLIEIKVPETKGAPFRLSAKFFNSKGFPSLFIIDNEWKAFTSNWDLEVSGGYIRIKDGSNLLHLSLKVVNSGTIHIEHLISKADNKLFLALNNFFRAVDLTNNNIICTFIDVEFDEVSFTCLSF